MPPPVQIAGVNDTGDAYIRPNGLQTDNTARSQTRVFRNGSALYTITWKPFGDEADAFSPAYYRVLWAVRKSTDGGATWAEVDAANHVIGGESMASGASDAVVQIGTKLWLIWTYGEHPQVSPTVYNDQFDEIRVTSFDMATDEWGPTVAGGPIREVTDVVLNFENLVCDACYRGSDEIVVFHRDTDPDESPLRALYSVFDIGTGAWTSTDTVVFTSAGSEDMEPDKCVHDGTYTHFFARAGLTAASATSEKKHRTLTGSTLGTVTNMFSAWDGSWPALSSQPQSEYGFAAVHGGEVVFVQAALLYKFAPFVTQWRIISIRAAAGDATPSWTIDDTASTAWDEDYFAPGNSGVPCLVEDGGSLYVIAGGSGLFTFPTTYYFSVYSQRYLGSGAWGAPVEMWNMQDAYGYGSSGRNEAYKLGAIGGLSGSAVQQKIGFIGSLEQFQFAEEDDTVYWFRALAATPCCCADYAY